MLRRRLWRAARNRMDLFLFTGWLVVERTVVVAVVHFLFTVGVGGKCSWSATMSSTSVGHGNQLEMKFVGKTC